MRRDIVIVVALLLPCAALAQQPAKPDKRQPGPETATGQGSEAGASGLRKRVEDDVRARAKGGARASLSLTPLAPQPNIRIDLDLNNVPVGTRRSACSSRPSRSSSWTRTCPRTPASRRAPTTCRLGTALDLITQSAGVRWAGRFKTAKRFTGSESPSRRRSLSGRARAGASALDLDGLRNAGPLVYRFRRKRAAVHLHLPPLQGSGDGAAAEPAAPVLRMPARVPERLAVLPHDGAKRPAVSGTWKFCPICGKAVSTGNVKQSGHGPDDITAVHLHR